LGDLILALPAIKALRDALQPAWLEIMGHPWTLPLIKGPPYADAITDINRAEMALLFQGGISLPAALQAYLGGFDAAFYFGLSATLADNLQRAGIRKAFLLSPFPSGRQHVADHHTRSLAALGINAPSSPPRIFLWEGAEQEAEGFFRAKGWEPDGIIALHPGAGSRRKAWPPPHFAALGRALARGSKRLLLVQGPADGEAVEEVVAGLHGIPYLVARDLPVRQLAALLSCASLFIGNDSGISHLAAALGVRSIALFGPTDPFVWAPRGEKTFWIQGDCACAPCERERQRSCERQLCLEQIGVDAVLACIAEVMKAHHEAPYNHRSPIHQQRVGQEEFASIHQ
jgi:ADP-heptose:LPS heptosyltransferase